MRNFFVGFPITDGLTTVRSFETIFLCNKETRNVPPPPLKRIVALALAVSLVGGCTTRPENVEARYVSPNTYADWTCDTLRDEHARLESEVARVSDLQRGNANADTAMIVGSLVFWPVLIGMAATKDRKDELGKIKGEYAAVELQQKTKQCVLPSPPPVSEVAKSTTP